MKLGQKSLQEIVHHVALSHFTEEVFSRAALMQKAEDYLRENGMWGASDDLPHRGARGKSTGVGAIDWTISEMKQSGALVHEGRNRWRLGVLPVEQFCGVLMKMRFGADTGIFHSEYKGKIREWAAAGEPWNTPKHYLALNGGGKRLLLYDPKVRGITVEFVVSRVERTEYEPGFPWSNFIEPGSVQIYRKPIPIDSIVQVPGLQSFKGRVPRVNLRPEQYQALRDSLPAPQVGEEGHFQLSQDIFRERDRALMEQRKLLDAYTCQACGFRLRIGENYIIDCHHVDPIRHGVRETAIADLVSYCPSCHRIAHSGGATPLSTAEIKEHLRAMATLVSRMLA